MTGSWLAFCEPDVRSWDRCSTPSARQSILRGDYVAAPGSVPAACHQPAPLDSRQGGCHRSLSVDAQQPIRNTALGPIESPFFHQQPANLVNCMDSKTGAEKLIAKVIRDDSLLHSLATPRLRYRFSCYDRVEGLAVSLRLVSKLLSGKQLVRLIAGLTVCSTSTWSADFSGDSRHGN